MEYEEVELKNGVLAFDGNVLEGFTGNGSQRVPVTQIKSIDVRSGAITVMTTGYTAVMTFPLQGDEAESSELNELLELVKGNALNMEGY